MKSLYSVWSLLIILLIIGIFIVSVNAQVIGRVSPRCQASQVDADYAYKIHASEGYTNYEVRLQAGRCERQFRGTINRISNIDAGIQADIQAQINIRNITWYPDVFADNMIDGRGNFIVP